MSVCRHELGGSTLPTPAIPTLHPVTSFVMPKVLSKFHVGHQI